MGSVTVWWNPSFMPFHQNPESASASAMRPISFTKKSFDGKYQFIRCHSVGGENLSLTLPLIYYFKSCCNQVNMKQRGRVVTLLCVIFRIMQRLSLSYPTIHWYFALRAGRGSVRQSGRIVKVASVPLDNIFDSWELTVSAGAGDRVVQQTSWLHGGACGAWHCQPTLYDIHKL